MNKERIRDETNVIYLDLLLSQQERLFYSIMVCLDYKIMYKLGNMLMLEEEEEKKKCGFHEGIKEIIPR